MVDLFMLERKKKYNHKADEIYFVCAPVKNSNPSQDSIAFCLSHYLIGISLVGLTLQVLGISRFSPLKRHLTIILPFIMATVVNSICLYEDEFTTSHQSVPSHIQVHLSDFWNYCLRASCCNTHLLVVQN